MEEVAAALCSDRWQTLPCDRAARRVLPGRGVQNSDLGAELLEPVLRNTW